jgi:hypothetical protein
MLARICSRSVGLLPRLAKIPLRKKFAGTPLVVDKIVYNSLVYLADQLESLPHGVDYWLRFRGDSPEQGL